MIKFLKSFIGSPYWNTLAGILGIFTFFGISSGTLIGAFGNYAWIMDATKWSLIIGALIFSIHAYVRAEKNRKRLINIKKSAFDEAYGKFTDQLSYGIGRYNGYVSNSDPGNPKNTLRGVLERMNEVKSKRAQLLLVCGDNVRSVLDEAGTEWLDDIDAFGKTAPEIMDNLTKVAFKDRT